MSALDDAREAIIDIIDGVESEDLPSFTEREDGCLWFDNLSMGWVSATDPEKLAERQIDQLFAAEAAGRELARRQRGSTCSFCGELTSVWPRRSCETPLEHVGATYDCDCGEQVVITDELGKHRRCNLIGDREAGYVSTVAFLLFIIAGSLVFLALLAGGQHVMCGQDPTIAYCGAGR